MEGESREHEYKQKLRGIKGKLFKKDKKIITDNNDDVSDFLHGPSDKLHMATATPTSPVSQQQLPLVRVDTSNAHRWPSAAEVTTSGRGRGYSTGAKRCRKGLAVRFTEVKPEIIGTGGDESEEPTSFISSRKRANSHPPGGRGPQVRPPFIGQQQVPQPEYGRHSQDSTRPAEAFMPDAQVFMPKKLHRTQTGFESVENRPENVVPGNPTLDYAEIPSDSLNHGFLKSEPDDQHSFAAMIQAEMRADEGNALTRGKSLLLETQSIDDESHNSDGTSLLTAQMDQVHLNTIRNSYIAPTTEASQAELLPGSRPQTPTGYQETQSSELSPHISRTNTLTIQAAAIAVGDEALQEFSRRMAHMFTLFRLSTENFKPIPACSLDDLVRAALWWFLKGRMDLEATIRERPNSPEAQRRGYFRRQQAHTDLAKALWLVQIILPKHPQFVNQQTGGNVEDVMNSRQAILTNLKKLSMSMKRNNLMPPDPDDAPLQQGLDPSIWIQDNGNKSLLSTQKFTSTMALSDAFPIGDTSRTFNYSRMFVEATLMEDDGSQQYHVSCLLSIIRIQREQTLRVLIASANGTLNLCIQGDRSLGPTWDDVEWRSKSNSIDIKLPRGFVLRIQCGMHDFQRLWGLYDYQNTIHASLFERRDEQMVFEVVLKTYQNFDQNPQSQAFPSEPINGCRVRLFERIFTEKAATGARKFHRGFRVAVVTGTKTKNLSGINQDFPPHLPIQFGFLRGDGGLPALLLKIIDGNAKSTMVFTFNDVHERAQMHARLTGVSLNGGEAIVAETAFKGFAIMTTNGGSNDLRCLKTLDWQGLRIINEEEGGLQNKTTVLSDILRVAMDFRNGSITDRFNLGPGELKLRLDVNSASGLKVIRQTQRDMTISVSEAQVSKELPHELAEVLRTIAASETTRTYLFPSLRELHLFQAALTGFKVLFDGSATSFNISRRRMVVPIYKKWDAATTRLQVVQKEKVIQLVAFFENFSHGDAMSFALKSTDIFESSTRSGKFHLKIVDAKFAMPKARLDDESGNGYVDSGFVCLDMPDYPGEHDDITIVFDTEAGMNSLESLRNQLSGGD
ncbi:hypothetical protein BP5796_07422 [Coleophoma crateriformis]|uniref:Uncharacterized protein n=1 Tax=Coleophoma crateriformis TaxID=565419 RepID=A0A3D8RJ33_9HELO|nr:hypothetical protein BP5796_07422 [Coleophoma crateriformis]